MCIFPSDCMPIDQVIKYSELRSSLGTRVRRQSPIPAEPGILLPHSTMYLIADLIIIKKGQDYDVHEPQRRIPFLTLLSTFQYPYIYKSKERESLNKRYMKDWVPCFFLMMALFTTPPTTTTSFITSSTTSTIPITTSTNTTTSTTRKVKFPVEWVWEVYHQWAAYLLIRGKFIISPFRTLAFILF